MPRQESIDELFANIDIEKFAKEYQLGMPLANLKRRYGISSFKSFSAFLESLISTGTIRKRVEDNAKGIEFSKKRSSEFSIQKRNTLTKRKVNELITLKNNSKPEALNDNYITDLILGIDRESKETIPINIEEKQTLKLEEVKNELITLWHAGVPSTYLSEKFGITTSTLMIWKDKLALPSRKVFPIAYGRTKRLERDIIAMQIKEEIDSRGILYLSKVKENYNLNDNQIRTILLDNPEINLFRLSFPSYKRTTQDTVLIFRTKAFDSIMYLDRKNLLAELLSLFASNPDVSSLYINDIRDAIDDLLYVKLTNDENSLVRSLWESQNFNLTVAQTKPLSYYKDELAKLKGLLTIWREVSSFADREKPVVESLDKSSFDSHFSEVVEKEILDILKSKGQKGTTLHSLSVLLKEIFPDIALDIKHHIEKLIEQNEIIRYVKGKISIYVYSQYKKDRSITIHINGPYGRVVKSDDFFRDLYNLDKGRLDEDQNNQTVRLAGLFMAQGFIVRCPKLEHEIFFDFIVESNDNEIYVKIDLQRELSITYILNCKQNLPASSSGIIVTLGVIDEKVSNILSFVNAKRSKNEYLQVWTKQTLVKLISQIKYEPAVPRSTVRIKSGQYHGLAGIVIANDFHNLLQKVSVLGQKIILSLPFHEVEEIPRDHITVMQSNTYSQLLSIVRSISDEREYHIGLDLILPPLSELSRRPMMSHMIFNQEEEIANKSNLYKSIIRNLKRPITLYDESNIIKINLFPIWEGFSISDDDNSNDLPQDFCRKKVISCDCIMWNDQIKHTPYLCRHMIASILKIWDDSYNKNTFIEGLKNLRFFMLDAFIIYNFFMRLVFIGSLDLCKLVTTALQMKLYTIFERYDFRQLLNLIEGSSYQSMKQPVLADANSSPELKILSQIIGKIDILNISTLTSILSQIPQLNTVFQRLTALHIPACITSMEELTKIFLNNRDITLNDMEHFVVEYLRYEDFPSSVSMSLTREAWAQGIHNIQDIINFVRESRKK